MYRHILIPTDGSHLSELAVRQGIKLAKSIAAKVTAITVFAPFHTIAIEPMMITATAEQYQKECDAPGREVPAGRERRRPSGRGPVRGYVRRARPSLPSHYPGGRHEGMRSDFHGLAWASGCGRTRARQRDDEGPDPHPDTGPGVPLEADVLLAPLAVASLLANLWFRARPGPRAVQLHSGGHQGTIGSTTNL